MMRLRIREPTTPPAASYTTLRETWKRKEPPSNSPMAKPPSKSFERSLASNPAESLPQPGVGLWTAAIHETISERRRTTIVGTDMKIGGLLPNDLGNRGSPIDGINDAFFIPFHNLSGYRPISAVGHRLSLKPLCNRARHASFAQFSPAPR